MHQGRHRVESVPSAAILKSTQAGKARTDNEGEQRGAHRISKCQLAAWLIGSFAPRCLAQSAVDLRENTLTFDRPNLVKEGNHTWLVGQALEHRV